MSTASSYSYLDLAVMPFLRKSVISQDAALLFTADFSQVLWANATGTELFGGGSIAELLDETLSANHPAVRQLARAADQIVDDEPIVRGFRVSRGLRTEMIQAELTRVRLPDGSHCILLVSPDPHERRRLREHEMAQLAVEALDDFADASAIVDEFGLIVASTDSFNEMDIHPETLEKLVRIAAHENDRLVKRPLEAGDGRMVAAGIGRVRDVPGRYLVVLADGMNDGAIDEPVRAPDAFETEFDETAGSSEQAAESAPMDAHGEESTGSGNWIGAGTAVAGIAAGASSAGDLLPPWLREPEEEGTGNDSYPYEDEFSNGGTSGGEAFDGEGIPAQDLPEDDTASVLVDEDLAETGESVSSADSAETRQPSIVDRWYFADGNASRGESAPVDDPRAPKEPDDHRDQDSEDDQPAGNNTVQATRSDVSRRFAFTIDANQVVQSVSPELAEAVGPVSADITGKSWEQISAERQFDEDGAILALLSRADTWSGKSVLWPVEGTDLVVPVDLAALPAFDRERKFDGFRGFGIIRSDDAVIDPKAAGQSLSDAGGTPITLNDAPQEDGAIEGEGRTQAGPDAELDQPDTGHESAFGSAGFWRSDIESDNENDHAPERNEPESDGPNSIDNGEPDDGQIMEGTGGGDQEENAPASREGVVVSMHGFRRHGEVQRTGNGRETANPDTSADTNGGLSGREKRAFSEIGKSLEQSLEEAAEDGLTFPNPAIIYRAGHTLFANSRLLELTGFDTIEALRQAGGIDAILDGEADAADDGMGRRILLRKRNGGTVPVYPILRRVLWQDEQALCLSFADPDSLPAGSSGEVAALDVVRAAELQGILETAADGIIIVDRNGRIETINASAEALFGREQAEVHGEMLASLFASESRKAIENQLESLRQPGVPGILNQGLEAIGIESAGGFIPLFVTVGAIGRHDRFCAVLRDLTEWKKTEEELVKARRLAETASEQKSEFLSRMSHEIREPLNAIIGFSDVMIEERFGRIENPRYREYLKDINRSGVHVLDLVNDLLDISKIEAGKLELSYEAVDLNQLASETVALLQPQANNNRIIIRTSLSRAVPKVVADARSVRQIILNLVSNAIRHSPRNSQVIVSTSYETNGEVGLRIRDTGRGMTAEEVERALEPFSQVHSDRLEERRGSGLGLPLTKALVEANRAYFDLESTPGEGTIAHIQFPSQRVLAD